MSRVSHKKTAKAETTFCGRVEKASTYRCDRPLDHVGKHGADILADGRVLGRRLWTTRESYPLRPKAKAIIGE